MSHSSHHCMTQNSTGSDVDNLTLTDRLRFVNSIASLPYSLELAPSLDSASLGTPSFPLRVEYLGRRHMLIPKFNPLAAQTLRLCDRDLYISFGKM